VLSRFFPNAQNIANKQKEVVMGFLDKIASVLSNKISDGENQGGLFEQVISLINNPETGGLSGLVSRFEKGGLGDIVSSWVGTGENAPITGDQIADVLGLDKIKEIAGKLGISDGQVSNGLASLLPQVVDRLTPDGKVPEGGMLESGLNALIGKFFK